MKGWTSVLHFSPSEDISMTYCRKEPDRERKIESEPREFRHDKWQGAWQVGALENKTFNFSMPVRPYISMGLVVPLHWALFIYLLHLRKQYLFPKTIHNVEMKLKKLTIQWIIKQLLLANEGIRRLIGCFQPFFFVSANCKVSNYFCIVSAISEGVQKQDASGRDSLPLV